MKLRSLVLLAALGFGLTACNNDGDDITSGEMTDGRVRINLALGRTETTKSLGATAAGLYNDIEKLEIAFYDGAGNYVGYPLKGQVGDVTYDNEKAINDALEALKTGNHETTLELKEVPGSATQMLVIANNKAEGEIKTATLNTVQGSLINLSEQNVDNFTRFSGEKSTLSGLDNAFDQKTVEGINIYEANVTLRPVPSRIELGDITAVNLPEGEEWLGPEIKEFKVLGYYINGFYIDGALDTKLNPSDRTMVDNGSTAADYTKEAYSKLTHGNFGFMCDEPTDGQITYAAGATSDEIWKGTTAEGKVWGYQVLKGEVPHVVVKLSVTYAPQEGVKSEPEVKFLTIDRFTYGKAFDEPTDADGDGNKNYQAGAPVKYFHRGHVYQINEIRFNVGNLTDAPYETTKTVSATVSVAPWKGVEIKPEFH